MSWLEDNLASLPELTTPADDDLVPIYDKDAPYYQRGKAIEVQNLRYSPPVWTVVSNLQNGTWTNILTGLANDDLVEGNGVVQSNTTRGDIMRFGPIPFSAIPTYQVWLATNPQNGRRIEIRRNGSNLQARTEGGPPSYYFAVRKY